VGVVNIILVDVVIDGDAWNNPSSILSAWFEPSDQDIVCRTMILNAPVVIGNCGRSLTAGVTDSLLHL